MIVMGYCLLAKSTKSFGITISGGQADGILFFALGIEVESPQRGTSEDLERKARPEGERQKELRFPNYDFRMMYPLSSI
jgi:hypothetical protein